MWDFGLERGSVRERGLERVEVWGTWSVSECVEVCEGVGLVKMCVRVSRVWECVGLCGSVECVGV